MYLAQNNEVATTTLINFFEKNEIRYCFPKIIALDQPLKFILATKDQKLIQSKFYPTLIEPADNESIEPDVIITPLLAFDSKLNRLGMGGGFFDRTIGFFRQRNPLIKAIGFAYDFQQNRTRLTISNLDQTLDFVVTESSIFKLL